jgi:hypothetical protein
MHAPVTQPEFYVEPERPHLGGYIVGGDPATYYPHLWGWLVREHGVRSVLDVGCGEGHAARSFALLDCDVIAIDGVNQFSHDWQFQLHDYTLGPWPEKVLGTRLEGATDLAWSCEFVEHVPEQHVPNFLPTFQMARMVAMTHAEPGQPGHHHVNCRTADYWIGAMAAAGFRFDAETTGQARLMAGMNRNPINHFARSGLVFRAA